MLYNRNCVDYFSGFRGCTVRLAVGLSFVLVFALLLSAQAEDLILMGTLSTPDQTSHLQGLDNADGLLYAVADNPGKVSCTYLINRWTAALVRDACFSSWIGACDDDSLNFKSNAFILGDCPGCGDYVVGDECGAIVRYEWGEDFGPDTMQTFKPTSFETYASGLVYQSDYYYAVDPALDEIHLIDRYGLGTEITVDLPSWIEDASGLTIRGENFLIVESSSDSLYEVDLEGVLVATYYMPGLTAGFPTGVTLIGDSLYVCSQDTTIKIYVFGETYTEPVPTGEQVEVVVVPDEFAVVFEIVTGEGEIEVTVSPLQPCPPPGGVRFFSDFYDVSTDAVFEYAAVVDLMTDTPLPDDVDPRQVRVFVRPSGTPCEPWRDVTVAPVEFAQEPGRSPSLVWLTRTRSEDDEFSVFALGEDRRHPRFVINLKFAYLDSAINGNQTSIPEETYTQLKALFEASRAAFDALNYRRAIRFLNEIADIARETPGIPHAYNPEEPGSNIAGQIISRAHTLRFSISLLISRRKTTSEIPPEGANPPATETGQTGPGLNLTPNPAVSGCTIDLSGRGDHAVSLAIYSVKGELIRTLLDGGRVTGRRTITWNGRNNAGESVAAGTYFVVLKEGDQSLTKKVVLKR